MILFRSSHTIIHDSDEYFSFQGLSLEMRIMICANPCCCFPSGNFIYIRIVRRNPFRDFIQSWGLQRSGAFVCGMGTHRGLHKRYYVQYQKGPKVPYEYACNEYDTYMYIYTCMNVCINQGYGSTKKHVREFHVLQRPFMVCMYVPAPP